jgi:two-component system phosphate regulon sensor histidine kinase PhoR
MTPALLVALLVASGAFALIRSSMRDRFIERIGAETALLADLCSQLDQADALQPFAQSSSAALGVRVTLIDRTGRVLADSATGEAGLAAMENHIGRPEVQAAREGGFGQSYRVSATTNVEYFYSARLVPGNGPVRYARIALPSNRVRQLQNRYAWLIAGVVALSLSLFTGVGYLAVRRFSRPMERMAAAVERSASGDFALTLPHEGGAEIRRLRDAVRQMQRAMTEKIAELDSERAVLASVISGMREGLLLIDPDRRIRLANKALRNVLDIAFDPEGNLLEEVVRHPSVLREVELALEEGGDTRQSVLRAMPTERIFELHVTPLSGPADAANQGVLALFFDITRLEKLEGVRREFVANVSHELRTPLTSIKAFVENMIDGGVDDAENSRKFLRIISKHADRMGALIEDLTDLSLIETGSVSLELRPVDAAEVAREVVEQLRPLATRNNISVEVEMPDDFPVVADRRRLEQMLTNLVENAVKFNREGGHVRIRGRREESGPMLEVEDTGLGIASDSLDRIFNRFYRAHRERPRDVGGTGLGLAIVKHLMRLHGGSVSVSSELGQGATFQLHFSGGAAKPRASSARPAETLPG